MLASEIYNQACGLLGYNESNLNLPSAADEISGAAISSINQIYADLFYSLNTGEEFKPIKRMTDEIILPSRILYNVMPYGVAMLIAQSESDGDNQALFASLYNQKRRNRSRIGAMSDVLPTPED